jgi:hypothetical protein
MTWPPGEEQQPKPVLDILIESGRFCVRDCLKSLRKSHARVPASDRAV